MNRVQLYKNEEWLKEQAAKDITLVEIARKADCHPRTIAKHMDKFDIQLPSRQFYAAQRNGHTPVPETVHIAPPPEREPIPHTTNELASIAHMKGRGFGHPRAQKPYHQIAHVHIDGAGCYMEIEGCQIDCSQPGWFGLYWDGALQACSASLAPLVLAAREHAESRPVDWD